MRNRIVLLLVFITIIAGLSFLLGEPEKNNVGDQVESLQGTILEIEEQEPNERAPDTHIKLFSVELETGEIVEVEQPYRPELQNIEFREGDGVIVDVANYAENATYVITDFQRSDAVIFLFLIFIVLVLFVGRTNGLFSLISLTASYWLIFQIMMGEILKGNNAVFTAIWVSAILIPFNYFISHGVSRKTLYAAVSTLITISSIGIVAVWTVSMAKLTGFTSDEAGFIQQLTQGAVNSKDLLLAGIIVGTLGILDDITISQTSIANELGASKKIIGFKELFTRTMKVGKDHIASLVNTLILVYTSASLPLLILLRRSNASFLTTLNREVIVEEIVIMLLTSIALIVAVPISTYIACYFIKKFGAEEPEGTHVHHVH